MSTLIVERANGLAVVTLNRPDKLNALSLELRHAFVAAFRDFGARGDVRVVVVTGAGRAFCAGLDLEEVGSGAAEVGRGDADADPVGAIAAFPGPVIGAVNGACVTGGLEIALACDMLYAAPAARFGDTHARVGLTAGWGLSQRLSRVIGIGRAKEMSLTGNFIDAATAERWGLVNRVVDADALVPAARDLAASMLSVAPEFLVHYKRVIDTGYGMALDDALRYEAEVARAWNNRIPASEVEARRLAIMARGKRQNDA